MTGRLEAHRHYPINSLLDTNYHILCSHKVNDGDHCIKCSVVFIQSKFVHTGSWCSSAMVRYCSISVLLYGTVCTSCWLCSWRAISLYLKLVLEYTITHYSMITSLLIDSYFNLRGSVLIPNLYIHSSV